MKTRQTIAIIGATGDRGSAIAKNLAKGHYRLLLMSEEEQKLQALKDHLQETAQATLDTIDCSRDACWEADVIIIATSYETEMDVAARIGEVATGKVVISISTPAKGAFNDLVTSPHTSAAEELQKRLPNSKVVKVFNVALAADLAPSLINNDLTDAFVAGNNGDAINSVSEILKTAGLNPVVVGDLAVSRTMERMTWSRSLQPRA